MSIIRDPSGRISSSCVPGNWHIQLHSVVFNPLDIIIDNLNLDEMK